MKALTNIALTITLRAVSAVARSYAQDSIAAPQLNESKIVLTRDQNEYSLGRHLAYLVDPGGELTTEDLTSSDYVERFTQGDDELLRFDGSRVQWVRLDLNNQTTQTEWLFNMHAFL